MKPRESLKMLAADHQAIAYPQLTPHLEYRLIGEGQVLLVSEVFNTLLHGQIYPELMTLLDGTQSSDQIANALNGTYSALEVHRALSTLAEKGYVISGDYRMERTKAAFWTSLGANPYRVEEKLCTSTVAIQGDSEGRLATALESVGIVTSAARPTLTIYICDDFLSSEYSEVNQRHINLSDPWLLFQPKGIRPLFGPVFRPAQQGPCWDCLSYRLANHQEVHVFVRNFCGEKAAFSPSATEPTILNAVYGIFAFEIAKWLILGDRAPLQEQVASLDAVQMRCEYYPVTRRPQCASCGDPQLRDVRRPALPVNLQSSPKNCSNSSGVRAVSPASTLQQYRHLVNPVSGIVTWLARTSPSVDPWLHVHWSGSNLALRVKSLSTLRRSLRSKSAGKGSTSEHSEVGSLCEAVERYSGAFHGEEISRRRRFSEFLADGEEQAIHPNDVQLFSNRQFEHADEINARGHMYNIVPPRFDAEQDLEWSPVWSFTENRHRYLPSAILYSMTPEQRAASGCSLWADSNGCAAGNTLEEAILQGFLELVERDAFAIWWYNRLRCPGVDLEQFNDDYLSEAVGYYRKVNRDMWVLNVTGDLGIPVFVAVSRRIDGDTEDIIYGAGAHIDPHVAVLRAVCEMNQMLTWVPKPVAVGDTKQYSIDDPLCLHWWKTAKLEDHSYLEPVGGLNHRRISECSAPDTQDLHDDIQWCRALIEAKDMEFLVLDQTRPDIGMPVVRVIVPGLRHFWERFAPGRLFDVPVQMGERQNIIKEADLNPVPVLA